jgi:DNA-binding transcriptional ArsR family regulator
MSSETDLPTNVQHMRDPKAMRAFAHPVRLEILDILRDQGPQTATEIAEQIGESPANTAFHLRTLAKYGFVEDAGGGTGRSRPWREKPGGMYVDESELTGEAKRSARAMVAAMRQQVYRRIERWARERGDYPEPWQKVGFEIEFRGRLSPDEVKAVAKKFGEALDPYKRSDAEAPDGAEKVTFVAYGFPSVAPPS